LEVRHPERTFATADHYVLTLGNELTAISEPYRREMVGTLADNARKNGITLFGLGDKRQGIVHVIGPEQGVTQPGRGRLDHFDIDPFRKQLLLSGMDDISFTRNHKESIAAFEARFAKELPWI
jgi:3-isopropylmalate dehydratase small subunit